MNLLLSPLLFVLSYSWVNVSVQSGQVHILCLDGGGFLFWAKTYDSGGSCCVSTQSTPCWVAGVPISINPIKTGPVMKRTPENHSPHWLPWSFFIWVMTGECFSHLKSLNLVRGSSHLRSAPELLTSVFIKMFTLSCHVYTMFSINCWLAFHSSLLFHVHGFVLWCLSATRGAIAGSNWPHRIWVTSCPRNISFGQLLVCCYWRGFGPRAMLNFLLE